MCTAPTTNKHIVSRSKYIAIKVLAICLGGSFLAAGLGIVLLLANLPYSIYLDNQEDAALLAAGGNPDDCLVCLDHQTVALRGGMFLLIPLLLVAYLLWKGARETRITLRAIEPITAANTHYLPASESLLRASQEPPTDQQAVLLRAAQQGPETPQEQLLRAIQPYGRE